MEAWELAFSPALDARMGAKAKSCLFLAAIRPMRQLSKRYAQAQRASARGLRDGFPLNQWPTVRTGCNVRRCTFVHPQGVGGPRAAFQLLLLDKWGHFRSKVGFKPGFYGLPFEHPKHWPPGFAADRPRRNEIKT